MILIGSVPAVPCCGAISCPRILPEVTAAGGRTTNGLPLKSPTCVSLGMRAASMTWYFAPRHIVIWVSPALISMLHPSGSMLPRWPLQPARSRRQALMRPHRLSTATQLFVSSHPLDSWVERHRPRADQDPFATASQRDARPVKHTLGGAAARIVARRTPGVAKAGAIHVIVNVMPSHRDASAIATACPRAVCDPECASVSTLTATTNVSPRVRASPRLSPQ